MVAVRAPWEARWRAGCVGATDLDVGPSTDDGGHRRAHDRVMVVRPLFRSVLCGVDGSAASRAAVGAAAAIVAGHGELHFLAVLHASGAGHPRGTSLTKRTADAALEAAVDRAAEWGVRGTTTVVGGWHKPATQLLEAARDHDLLVVGGHGGGGSKASRSAGPPPRSRIAPRDHCCWPAAPPCPRPGFAGSWWASTAMAESQRSALPAGWRPEGTARSSSFMRSATAASSSPSPAPATWLPSPTRSGTQPRSRPARARPRR